MHHFCQDHEDLRDIDATIEKLGYHSANEIVNQIMDHIREEHGIKDKTENASPVLLPLPLLCTQ